MTAVDPIAALRALILSSTDVSSQVGDRVYGGELPKPETKQQPRKAVVIKYSGGTARDTGYQQWGPVRVDIRCHGATPEGADQVWRAVFPLLKQARPKQWAGCTLLGCMPAGGPIPLRDIETQWPYVFSSWQVNASEIA